MYTLYYGPGSAAMAPHAALEEIGAEYTLVPTEIAADKPRDPAFLKLNPNGWVPVLIDENGPIHESAAIMMYLAERHPEAGLAPPSSDPTRAHCTARECNDARRRSTTATGSWLSIDVRVTLGENSTILRKTSERFAEGCKST